jgi:hypothetical protein
LLTGKPSNGASNARFREGFRHVFSDGNCDEDTVNKACDWLRNGLYHSSMPKSDTKLSREFPDAIVWKDGVLRINPALMVRKLRSNFDAYIELLKDEEQKDLRKKFEIVFDGVLPESPILGGARDPKTPGTSGV